MQRCDVEDCIRLRAALLRSIDEDASPSEALLVARHLGTCTACRIVAARARRLACSLDALDDAVALDDEAFLADVMAALPATPPPAPARGIERRRLAWLRRKRVHLAGISVLLLLAGEAAWQSSRIPGLAGGGAVPRWAEAPEDAARAASMLATLVGLAFEHLGAGGRFAPSVPDLGLAAATSLSLAGLAATALGAATIAAAWRGRALRG
jgi:predicted anti-sigma-YlaC factor YlaD